MSITFTTALIRTRNLDKHQEMRFDTHKIIPIEFRLVSFFKLCLTIEETSERSEVSDSACGNPLPDTAKDNYNIPIIIPRTKTYIKSFHTHIRLHGKARQPKPPNVNLFWAPVIYWSVTQYAVQTKAGSFHYNQGDMV